MPICFYGSLRDLGFGAEAAPAVAAEAAPAVAEESPVASNGDGAAPA